MLKKLGKNKLLIWIASSVIRFYIYLVFKTCKIELRFSEKSMKFFDQKKQTIVCFWHGRMLLFPSLLHSFGSIGKFVAVISGHGNGQLIANIIERYGHYTARGSSRKDSVKALHAVIKAIKSKNSLGLTPDGPKGPKFKVKGNIVNLALKYKVPMIPVSFSCTSGKILNTWDSFLLPIPFKSKIIVEIGKPILVDKNKNGDTVLEESMNSQMQKLDKECGLSLDY